MVEGWVYGGGEREKGGGDGKKKKKIQSMPSFICLLGFSKTVKEGFIDGFSIRTPPVLGYTRGSTWMQHRVVSHYSLVFQISKSIKL